MRPSVGLSAALLVVATMAFVSPAQASTIAASDYFVADLAPASGPLLGQTPPANLIVQAGGLDWVWAAPCAPIQPSCDPGGVVFHDGFGIPTAAQWTNSWPSLAALVAAFTPGGGQLCASPYFSTSYSHCDSGDLIEGAIWHAPAPIGLEFTDDPAAESFLVRGAVAAVPEPATIGLVLTGLALAFRVRRKI